MRVWVIQELTANKQRILHCGQEKVEWERVDLVAGYIMMEPAFSQSFGFSNALCWWVTTITRFTRNPENWLSVLYLASNYSALDARDVVFDLRGLINCPDGGELLDPDYSKSRLEVYRDSVEAAIINFQNTDVFTYVTGDENPSWIPQWDRPMLFRNPFRFGNAPPWRPSGETTPPLNFDKKLIILSLTGFIVDSVKFVHPYNERFFCNAMMESDKGKSDLTQVWRSLLKTVEDSQPQLPLNAKILTALATSFSFGLDENAHPTDERGLARNFAAYLKMVLDKETFVRYIPSNLAEESKHANGRRFGKPVWDFPYPESSFFITQNEWIACTVSKIKPADLVCVALGSTYPFILRSNDDEFLIKGYAYVHRLMNGEQKNSERRVFRIR